MEKAQRLERALLETCPFIATVKQVPNHSPDVLLVMYGAGEPSRTAMMQAHLAAGGQVVCWDRGYFGRSANPEHEHFRLAINRLHVSPEHVEGTPDAPSRFARFGIELRSDCNPHGRVIVVGMGQKSRVGLNVYNWETTALQDAKHRFPNHKIVYRPKMSGSHLRADKVRWTPTDGRTPIETLLRNAALVIVRHSNVAVDACIAGIPVECADGAARWLYASRGNPDAQSRRSFLNRLAWWNWRVDEMADAWKFLVPRLKVNA